jgi:hypothetical protein
MANVLGREKREQVLALGRLGWPLRRIEEATGGREEAEAAIRKVRNALQNPLRAAEVLRETLHVELFEGFSDEERDRLVVTLSKRHPITHNLGVADLAFLARTDSTALEGRDVPLDSVEVMAAASLAERALAGIYRKLSGRGSEADPASPPGAPPESE